MCDAGSSPTRTVASPTWPSSATEAATSSRTFAPSALPSIRVAATRRGYSLRSMRLPRKNDADSIRSRQQTLGLPEVDLEPWGRAAESVTGLVSIPVSVARLQVSLGEYELSEEGDVVETSRSEEEVTVPLAHTEGGLTASVQRGAKAIAESGGCRTYVIADRITRASCFVCKDSGDALTLARWVEQQVPALREFLRDSDIPELSRHAVLREAKDRKS